MNRIILSLILLLFSTWRLTSQITVTNASFPAAGDTLRVAFDTTSAGIMITPPGGNQNWEFTGLNAAFTRTIVFKAASEGQNAGAFPAATLVAPAGQNGENYYQATSGEFRLIGFAGNDPLGFDINVVTPFNPPVVERRAPMNFFDVNQAAAALLVPFAASELPQAILNLLPIVPDSVRLRVDITRVDVVDGWGTLTIPGGTYPVLRERRTQYTDTRIEVKIGALPWFDVTQLIPLPGAGLGRDTTLTYDFFSNSAKEPVAVVTADHNNGEVLSVQYKFNGIISSAGDVSSAQPDLLLYPNPASGRVRIEGTHLPLGRYDFSIFNSNGQLLLRQPFEFGGEAITEMELDLTGLPAGVHAYVLAGSSGNVLKTGRLVITSGR